MNYAPENGYTLFRLQGYSVRACHCKYENRPIYEGSTQ